VNLLSQPYFACLFVNSSDIVLSVAWSKDKDASGQVGEEEDAANDRIDLAFRKSRADHRKVRVAEWLSDAIDDDGCLFVMRPHCLLNSSVITCTHYRICIFKFFCIVFFTTLSLSLSLLPRRG
jgi:hypothetical protein